MTDFLSIVYPWTKSLHVISVIAWMAGIFYLPRLFVYHVETDRQHADPKETFEKWELLLLKRIMNPAMISTWIFGLALVATPGIINWAEFWPWVKAALVLGMTYYHHWLAKECKRLANGTATRSGKAYRLLNEVPTLLMVGIVIMVIARPF